MIRVLLAGPENRLFFFFQRCVAAVQILPECSAFLGCLLISLGTRKTEVGTDEAVDFQQLVVSVNLVFPFFVLCEQL